MNVSFLYPKFLFFLFLIPLFILAYFIGIFYYKKKAVIFPNFEALERVFGVEILSKNFIALIINVAILLTLVLGISGMSISYAGSASEFSYVLAIDNSGSMNNKDIIPNRLEAAKNSAKIFIDALPAGVKVGVISFSGDSWIVQDIKNSKLEIKMAIDSIEAGNIEGTDIDKLANIAINMLKNEKKRAIVIVSDGQINAGNIERVIQSAKAEEVVINAIAIGASGEESGTGVFSVADENNLREIAYKTGGEFLRAGGLGSLDSSFKNIISRSEGNVSIDISPYLLISAVILFSLNWILYIFKFRAIP